MFRHTTVFLCSGCGLVGGINRRASCAGIPPSARPLFSVVYSCLTWLCAACISSILCHFHTCSYDIILRLLEQGRTAKKKQAFFFRGGRVVPTSNHSPLSFFWYRTYTRTRTLELPRWEVSEAFKSSTSSRVSPSFSLSFLLTLLLAFLFVFVSSLCVPFLIEKSKTTLEKFSLERICRCAMIR